MQRTNARIKICKEKKTAWTFEQILFVENEPITEKTKLTNVNKFHAMSHF